MVMSSVVITAYNNAEHLAETLDALVAQTCDQPWEIVFADNGSTDGSQQIFADFAARNPEVAMVAIDASQYRGKSFALNAGIAKARSDRILVLDADDVPAAGWLQAMTDALGRHDFVTACNELERLNVGPTGRYRAPPADGVWRIPYPPYVLVTAGATMAFTRRLFDAVGGFDPDVYPEDVEFCIRAALKGFEPQTVRGAILHYRLRGDLSAIYRQARCYHKTNVLVSSRYRALGPAQRGRWVALLRACRVAALVYLRWRLDPTDLRKGAGAYRRLGLVAGQLAGMIAYRAGPSLGHPPASAIPVIGEVRPNEALLPAE